MVSVRVSLSARELSCACDVRLCVCVSERDSGSANEAHTIIVNLIKLNNIISNESYAEVRQQTARGYMLRVRVKRKLSLSRVSTYIMPPEPSEPTQRRNDSSNAWKKLFIYLKTYSITPIIQTMI